jgi:hypothetical protein
VRPLLPRMALLAGLPGSIGLVIVVVVVGLGVLNTAAIVRGLLEFTLVIAIL